MRCKISIKNDTEYTLKSETYVRRSKIETIECAMRLVTLFYELVESEVDNACTKISLSLFDVEFNPKKDECIKIELDKGYYIEMNNKAYNYSNK